MKAFALALVLFFVSSLSIAAEPTSVPVRAYGVAKWIATEIPGEAEDASTFADPRFAIELFEKMKSRRGPLRDLLESIRKENVGPDAEPGIPSGDLTDPGTDNTILVEFGRGGWASAGAVFRTTLLWVEPGSGSFASAVVSIDIRVEVEAFEPEGDVENEPRRFEITATLVGYRRLAGDSLTPF